MNFRHNATSKIAEGFSLLEVLVATTLVGMMLIILLQVLSSIFRVEAAIQKNNQAILIAEKILQENCNHLNFEAGTYEGQEDDFVYQIKVTPQYEVSDTSGDLKIFSSLIQVTVSWKEHNKKKSFALETVRTGPKRKTDS
jgi:general secretion pathway protein I